MTPPEMPSIVLAGTGSYAPSRVMTNDELSEIVDTSDEWIRARTGIRERRIAAADETTSDMAAKAAADALRAANCAPEDIELVVVATVTPDRLFPNTACFVQEKLGLGKVPAFDLEAACSGYLYALNAARGMMLAQGYRRALVIGAEKLSSITNWADRTTCVLFGDGAGAAILEMVDEPGVGIRGSLLGADGKAADLLGTKPVDPSGLELVETVERSLHHIHMNGREVFKHAVRVMCQSATDILEMNGVKPEEVSLIVPHQANNRIIEALAQRLEIGLDRFKINLDRYGNTSAASIPIALDEAYRNGRIHPGDWVLMVAFGGGLTWAATLVKWHGC